MPFFLNAVISALIIATVVEISSRSSFMASLLVSLPITSILTFVLVYLRTGDQSKVAQMSADIFWLVLPSLGLFLLLPWLFKLGWGFWPSLVASCVALAATYPLYSWILKKSGIL